MTEICLIRHGETDWNTVRRFQGVSDIPLNNNGMQQAHITAQKLADLNKEFAAIYSSPLIRAKQTASAVSDRFGLPIFTDRRLQEINQGDWQGLLYDEIWERYPDLSKVWFNTPLEATPPGEHSEGVMDVLDRATSALNDISRKYPDESVVVVSHGFVSAVIRCLIDHVDLNKLFPLIPKNAEVVIFDWSEDQELLMTRG